MPSPSSSSSSSSYINLRKWAESDAEFVRSLSSVSLSTENRACWPPASPTVIDSFSCRQLYLRSYAFSKKEPLPKKAIKCFEKFKRKAIDHLHCFSDDISYVSGKEDKKKMILKKKKKKKKKKGRSVFFSVLHRLLSCGGCFQVVDGGSSAVIHVL
ncbi:uncharacterized protein LOC110026671 [Phalaenopsis equestris]|uniref:uncharacterized protein LOC110026671 n=1 Tax=Phalaenopsis equestris TaxID=78828 RepID=UPI0009E5B036|nr:uncharacterized protein LOC110026671 [Phalaenopsis equestris]